MGEGRRSLQPCQNPRSQSNASWDLMHLHENPKRSDAKILAAGQPCKIDECNEINLSVETAARQDVVPANAGTHTPRPRSLRKCLSFDFVSTTTAGGYGSLRSQGRRRELPFRARLLGRALCGFGEPGGERRSLGGRSPA